MIDRKKTQYVILYVNHNIPSILQWDPKASVLLWLERRRPAQNERHQKQYISAAPAPAGGGQGASPP